MNKQQIKAELRRSACEDECPMFCHLSRDTFKKALEYLSDEFTWDVNCENKRIFFLLVAAAL